MEVCCLTYSHGDGCKTQFKLPLKTHQPTATDGCWNDCCEITAPRGCSVNMSGVMSVCWEIRLYRIWGVRLWFWWSGGGLETKSAWESPKGGNLMTHAFLTKHPTLLCPQEKHLNYWKVVCNRCVISQIRWGFILPSCAPCNILVWV